MVSGHLRLLYVQNTTRVGEVDRRRSTVRSLTDYCWWMTGVCNLKMQMCFEQQNHSSHMWTYLKSALFSVIFAVVFVAEQMHLRVFWVSFHPAPMPPENVPESDHLLSLGTSSCLENNFLRPAGLQELQLSKGFPWPELVTSPRGIPAFSISLFLPLYVYNSLKMGLLLM